MTILVIPVHPLLQLDILLKVQEGHEPVLVDNVIMQAAQTLSVTRRHEAGVRDKVHEQLDTRPAIVCERVVGALGVEALNLLARRTKGVDVILAHQLGDLDVGAVERTEGHGAIEHELHVRGTACLLARQRDLLGDVSCGDEVLRRRDVVVLDHKDLEVWRNIGILGHPVGQREDEVDDVLGDNVGGCRLSAKDDRDGTRGQIAVLDVQVLPNDVEREHLLSLILMDTLHLHVDDRVLGNARALVFEHELPHTPLGAVLRPLEPLYHCLIVQVLLERREVRALVPVRTDGVVQKPGELGVAAHDPAAKRNAVRLVAELLGIDLIEGRELRVLQDLGMERCYPIDAAAKVDRQVCHMDHVILDDGNCGISVTLLGDKVELHDNIGYLRSNGLEELDGPFLKGLSQDRVVGVGDHPLDHRDGLVEAHIMLLGKQANELGDDHSGMRVIDLHHGIVGQVTQVTATLQRLAQDELGRVAHHEILLVHAKQTSLLVRVVGVEEEREVLLDLILVKLYRVGGDQRVIHALEVEEPQAILG